MCCTGSAETRPARPVGLYDADVFRRPAGGSPKQVGLSGVSDLLGEREVHRSVVGGVRVLTAELPDPVLGALMFRVGTADEPFPLRGITHLVEHLAMFHAGPVSGLESNAFVELDRTMLWARGSREDVLAFLGRVADGLHQLPAERLASEMRVLKTEAASRSGTLIDRLLRLRFGGSGYGMADYVEKAMGWLDGPTAQRWANQWFCAENCVGVLTSATDGLELRLPRGEPAPDPALDSLPGLPFPAQVRNGVGNVAATFVTTRSWEAAAGTAFAAEMLHDSLRTQDAISYRAFPVYTRLGADGAHLTLAADCLDENAARVRERLWETVQTFADAGPSSPKLEEWQAGFDRSLADRDALARAELDRIARELLWGREPEDIDALHEQRRQLTPESIAAAFTAALPTMLLVVPTATEGQIAAVPAFVPEPPPVPDGRVFKFKDSGLKRDLRRRRVVISDDAVCLVRKDGEVINVRTADCIGAERSNQMLRLFSRDGSWLGFKPAALLDGHEALGAVMALIPPAKFLGNDGAVR
jgi:zinc protease